MVLQDICYLLPCYLCISPLERAVPSTLTRAELTATASTLPKPSLGGQGGGQGGLEVGMMGEEGSPLMGVMGAL